jgi:hypothetical protein
MTIDDAIYTLETYGRHMGNRFIAINHDKSCKLLLQQAVEVLESAGMIERDSVEKYRLINVKIVNRPKEKTDFIR